jgi:hypothetical protein
VDAVASEHLDRLTVQRIHEAHRAVSVRQVNSVILNKDPVGKQKCAIAPAAQIVAVPIEDDNRRVFALKGIDPILRIRRYGTDHGKRFTGR